MNAIVTKREFNVPVEILYKAFSQADRIKEWWGPDGFTNTFYEFNFYDGGTWRFTMYGPDGKGYENESEFVSVKENELIILHHISKPEYTSGFYFSAKEKSSSSLLWEMMFATDKAYQSLKDIVTEKNEENLKRLEAILEKIK